MRRAQYKVSGVLYSIFIAPLDRYFSDPDLSLALTALYKIIYKKFPCNFHIVEL